MTIIQWQYLSQSRSTFTYNLLQQEYSMLAVAYPCEQHRYAFEAFLIPKRSVHKGCIRAAATLSKVRGPNAYVEVKSFSINRLLLSLEIVSAILLCMMSLMTIIRWQYLCQ